MLNTNKNGIKSVKSRFLSGKKLLTFLIALIAANFVFAQTSGLIISEIADGTGTGGYPKIVEITNTNSSPIVMDGMKLNIYVNGSPTPGTPYIFTSYSLPAGESVVLTNIDNVTADQLWSDFNLSEPANVIYVVGAVNSNGNDVYELTEPSDVTIDVYGVIGVDGTGEVWEFLDSYSYRNSDITDGNSTFTASEWTIAGPDVLDGQSADLSPYLTPGTHVFGPFPLTINLGVDTCLSIGDSLMLDAGVSGINYTYDWSTGADTQTIWVYYADSAVSYWVQVTDTSITETASDTIVISPCPAFIVDLGADTCLSEGDSLMLDAGVSGINYTYDWSTGADTQTIWVYYADSAISYWVQVTDTSISETDSDTIIISPCPVIDTADIVITEIMYNPPESGTDSLEFIEIYNKGAEIIDLTGYTFTGVNYTFSSVTMNPGEYVIVCEDSTKFHNFYGVAAYTWSGNLLNGGEAIVIKNNFGITLDSVFYDDVSPWPTEPNGDGQSLVLCDPDSDNNDPANWFASTTFVGVNADTNSIWASPGALDSICIQVDIEEFVEAIPGINCYPNPSNGIFNISINENIGNELIIEIISIQGQIVYSERINKSIRIKQINLAAFSRGVYYLRLNTGNTVYVGKVVIQ